MKIQKGLFRNVQDFGGSINNAIMNNLNESLFISYAKEDYNQYVIPFISTLEEYNLNYWLDTDQIHVGDKVFEKLEDRILNVSSFIVFISERFFNKKWCLYELDLIIKNNLTTKLVMPIVCGGNSLRIIKDFPQINGYAFEELASTFDPIDIQKVVHRIIKTLICKHNSKISTDFTLAIHRLKHKSIHNKEIIIYFIHLLANFSTNTNRESIFITNNICDLILADIMRKNNYKDKRSTFISKERFPQEILFCIAVIENSKSLVMTDNDFPRLLQKNCTYAFSILLEWYLS